MNDGLTAAIMVSAIIASGAFAGGVATACFLTGYFREPVKQWIESMTEWNRIEARAAEVHAEQMLKRLESRAMDERDWGEEKDDEDDLPY